MTAIEGIIIDFIGNVYDAIGWPGVIALMAIESACIPLPSELIMPFAGWFLIEDKGLGIGWVFFAAFCGALGNLLGSLVAYWIGWTGGRPFLERFGKYLLISRHELDSAERWFAKHGDSAVLVSRLIPVVRTFVSLPAGIAKMNLVRFSVFTFLGSYPFSLGLAYGGYQLGEHWERLRNVMRPFDIPILVVIAAAIILYAWRRYKQVWSQAE